MMGAQDCKGVIPRLCDALFGEIADRQTPELTYKVEVSYMEIYNEKVHDLLDPRTNKQSLKVREHVVLGPYVDGLSRLAVMSFQVSTQHVFLLRMKCVCVLVVLFPEESRFAIVRELVENKPWPTVVDLFSRANLIFHCFQRAY